MNGLAIILVIYSGIALGEGLGLGPASPTGLLPPIKRTPTNTGTIQNTTPLTLPPSSSNLLPKLNATPKNNLPSLSPQQSSLLPQIQTTPPAPNLVKQKTPLFPKVDSPIPPSTQESIAEAPEFDPIFDMTDPSTLLEMDEQALANIPAAPKRTITSKSAYDKKLEEASQRLLGQIDMGRGVPGSPDQRKPLIPLLPLLATSRENTPKGLENKGPTPLLQAPPPPHPPLLSAMNTPIPPAQKSVADMTLFPMMAGAGMLPSTNRDPASTEEQKTVPPAQVTNIIPPPKTVAIAPLRGVADIAVILSGNSFYPSKIRLKEDVQTRLIFTTTNKKPAALVMERLQIQRWIAKEKDPIPSSEQDRARWEVNRELSSSKVTEVVLQPKRGSYSFHDAISGASGEIEVEEK